MKHLSCILTILFCIALVGCSSKNDLSDIKVNELDSKMFTQEEYHQILDEFVQTFNESDNSYKEVTITEISYVSDDCLQQEIKDWIKDENIDDNEMEFMLLKLNIDTYKFIDEFNVNTGYPNDFYYFIGKKKGGKWEVLQTGLAYPGAYDLQCELK